MRCLQRFLSLILLSPYYYWQTNNKFITKTINYYTLMSIMDKNQSVPLKKDQFKVKFSCKRINSHIKR